MDQVEDESMEPTFSASPVETSTQPKRKRKNNFDTVMEKMTEISNKRIDVFMRAKEIDGSPEIRDFFTSISRTVEKFSSYDQAIAKKRVLDLITDIELGRIQSSSSTGGYYSPNTAWPNNNYHTQQQNAPIVHNQQQNAPIVHNQPQNAQINDPDYPFGHIYTSL